jgi:hypothetical protein
MADPPPVRRTGAAALALRLSGAGYDDVANALGLASAQSARLAAEEALAARAWDDRDGRVRLRAENGARLERLLRSVWSKATNEDHPEHLPAVRVARELIDRYARLYGLDAPSEVIIHNPTASEIESWVAEMLAESTSTLRAMEAPVAAIVDADVIEDLVDAD